MFFLLFLVNITIICNFAAEIRSYSSAKISNNPEICKKKQIKLDSIIINYK